MPMKLLPVSVAEKREPPKSEPAEVFDRVPARLKLLVEKLQRMLFGAKSERVLRQIEQLELQLEELQAAGAIEEAKAAAPAERPAAARPFRRPLPAHLPREVRTHMPGHEACPDCGGKLREIGEDVAEMLEHVRACFKPGSPRTGLRSRGGR